MRTPESTTLAEYLRRSRTIDAMDPADIEDALRTLRGLICRRDDLEQPKRDIEADAGMGSEFSS